MISALLEEKSNRLLVKESNYHGFSKIYIFEDPINYLVCNHCHGCIKLNEKMTNMIDNHKSSCKYYPKKPSTLDVHKICFREGFDLIFKLDSKSDGVRIVGINN